MLVKAMLLILSSFLFSCQGQPAIFLDKTAYPVTKEHNTCSLVNFQTKDIPIYNKHLSCDERKAFPQMIRIPNFRDAWQIVYSCKKYKAADVSSALSLFYVAWKAKFGDPYGEVWEKINTLLIEWSPEKKKVNIAFGIHGNKVKNPRILGLAISSDWIWVHTDGEPMYRTIGNTSFIHELVHIALWVLPPYFEPDADHEGSSHGGWTKKHTSFIYNINWMLMEKGI